MLSFDCNCENWYAGDEESKKWVTQIEQPDFKGDLKKCWHLRGRGWRWRHLRADFTDLQKKEFVFSFWGKFDYYSGRNSRCYVCLYHNGKDPITYDISPNSPYAVARAGAWYLYKVPIRLAEDNNLTLELVSFEANFAIYEADPKDEKDPQVTWLQEEDKGTSYDINEELPYGEFTCLEQRIVKYYWDLLAPYHPSKEIPEAAQLEYYEFVKGLYHKLFSKPEEFFSRLNTDDAFPNRFNCNEYGKPELKPLMKKARIKLEDLFQLLYTLGSTGEEVEEGLLISFSLSKKQRTMLAYMDLDLTDGMLRHKTYPKLQQALRYLAGKEKQPLSSLLFCWFDPGYPYLEKTHEKFYDREQYQRLIDWFNENGYRNSIGSNTGFGTTLTLDYTKSISKKEEPVGYALFGDKYHYGFTFEYRPDPRVMQHCEIRIIQFFDMLRRFNDLSPNTQKLLRRRTKICDSCRYCIQTDKTGTRPMAAVKIADGTARCPYYPGFSFTYECLTKKDVDDILAFLTDLEQVVIKKVMKGL